MSRNHLTNLIGVSTTCSLWAAIVYYVAISPTKASASDEAFMQRSIATTGQSEIAVASPSCCPTGSIGASRPLAAEVGMMFDTSDFPPRWQCGTWSSALGWTHILSDIVMGLAFFGIASTLVYFAFKRTERFHPKLLTLFATVFLFCALTHLMESVIFYWPAYRVAALLKIVTACVSVAAVIAFLPMIPQLLQLRTPEELKRQVAEQTTQLRTMNRTLASTVTELAEARAVAEKATRAKSNFLANMSHEIRTPMTAILGFTDILIEDSDRVAEVEKAAETIQRNGRHLLSVVNNILDISKIESGKLEIESISFNPRELIEDACQLHQLGAREKGLALLRTISNDVPNQINSDPTRLRQILCNLISNAVKFTQRGVVRVTATVQQRNGSEMLLVDVTDTGIGLSAARQQSIFQPFCQADASTAREYGGSGLGLTISRRLSELMNGSLEIVQSAPNEGSHFRLVIPLIPSLVRSAVTPEKSHAEVKRDKAARSTLLSGVRVLLAEDGEDNQRVISVFLKSASATLTIVENGLDAFNGAMNALASQPFDVILMDMQMPVMDGYSATRKLREADYRGAIIALTAHAMAADRVACLDAGCDEYLTKPIDRELLVNKVWEHAAKRVVSAIHS